MKKVSVVTINFNNQEGLSKTVKSVLNQSFKDFEFLVIDGGSTDGSKAIIENNKRIDYWVSEKDKGVYSAMNKGIVSSSGEYVIFMNSGDIFYDDHVLENSKNHLKENLGIVYGNSYYYNDSGFVRNDRPPKKLSFSFFATSGITHQAVYIKRQLFYDYFFYNENYKIAADWDFFIRNICLQNISYKYIDLFICRYDFSGVSADQSNYHLIQSERKETLKKFFSAFYNDADFLYGGEISLKRLKQFVYIKKHKITWKIVRGVMNFCLLFLPKDKD